MNSTLWGLLEEYRIEIPPIQRDYAQGRSEGKVPSIRSKFINAILHALRYDEPLGLDFIYGKVYGQPNQAEFLRNKQVIESLLQSIKNYADTVDLRLTNLSLEEKVHERGLVHIIPLDGQQRLTTLFLVHWYFLYRSDRKEELSVLQRFRYKTRKSSESFLQLLLQIEKLSFGSVLSEEIIQDEHFSNTWLDDPTVVSMLKVIDEIHHLSMEIPVVNFCEYAHRLISKKVIYFEFLDVKDFDLEDDLYVKMNARGKQLSEFENFKAWLFGKLEKRSSDTKKWEADTSSFDIEWNDIFWNAKVKGVFEVDKAYLNYFKLMYLLDLLKIVPVKGSNFVVSDISGKIDKVITNSALFDFEIDFDDEFFARLESYFKILDLFSGCDLEERAMTFFFSDIGIKPTWQDLIRHYIYISYVISKNKPLVEYDEAERVEFTAYMRIMTNLFENSIIDNQSNYKKAVNEIDLITKKLKELSFVTSEWGINLVYLADSVFSEHQMKEERLKAKLLKGDPVWRNLILEAESHKYFQGELNVLFYLSDMDMQVDGYQEDYLSDIYKVRFAEYAKKLFLLIGPAGLDRVRFKENIFERALLTRADYLLSQSGNKCFGRDMDRDVSWKRLMLRDRNSNDTNLAIAEVFSKLDFENPGESFENFIASNTSGLPAYREVFASNHRLFRSLNSLKYIKKTVNHGWVMITEGYKTNTGRHYELFSRDFLSRYLEGKEALAPFGKAEYYASGKDDPDDVPCAVMKWNGVGFIYVMDILCVDLRYRLRFYEENRNISAGIIGVLEKHNFRFDNEDCVCDYKDRDETYVSLKLVCKDLNNLRSNNLEIKEESFIG